MASGLFLALLCCLTWSRPESTRADFRPLIWTRGHYNSALKIDFPPDRYRYDDAANRSRVEEADGYLAPQERENLIARLGIAEKLAALDEMDKDILVMSAREMPVSRLKSIYPMLSQKDLQALKKARAGGTIP